MEPTSHNARIVDTGPVKAVAQNEAQALSLLGSERPVFLKPGMVASERLRGAMQQMTEGRAAALQLLQQQCPTLP
ncbi:MAG: hypothetical protein ACRYGK_18255 [Janthinobacterium lividum]